MGNPGDDYGLVAMAADILHWRCVVSPSNVVYVLIALTIWVTGYPLHHATELHLKDARITEHLGWMAEVVSRNLVLTLVVYQTWHHLLYVRDPPLSDAKINPRFPSTTQHLQCAGLTLLGSVVASCYEIAFVHAWAAGGVTYVASLFASPVGVPILLLQLAVSAYVADSHFYAVHRIMHPWWSTGPNDPGAVIYRHVHAWHHLSVNPGPWSGLAMHPVEHVAYLSRSLWIPFVTAHPLVFLFTNTRAMLGPAPGHHGFEDHFGSRFHNVHHQKYRCNYGTRGYLDRYFGTFDLAMPPVGVPSKHKQDPATADPATTTTDNGAGASPQTVATNSPPARVDAVEDPDSSPAPRPPKDAVLAAATSRPTLTRATLADHRNRSGLMHRAVSTTSLSSNMSTGSRSEHRRIGRRHITDL